MPGVQRLHGAVQGACRFDERFRFGVLLLFLEVVQFSRMHLGFGLLRP